MLCLAEGRCVCPEEGEDGGDGGDVSYTEVVHSQPGEAAPGDLTHPRERFFWPVVALPGGLHLLRLHSKHPPLADKSSTSWAGPNYT